jgi:hypothetical protein
LCSTTTVFLSSSKRIFKTPALNGDIYIRLYPNPVTATSKLEIISASKFTLGVSVYDNTGKKVMIANPTESLPAGQVIKPINAAVLLRSIYLLAVTINGKTQTIKMIVAH